MELLVTIVVIILILFGVSLYCLYNILTKYEQIEDELDKTDDLILNIYKDLESANNRIRKLDRLGSFESDDETGFIFTQIKTSINSINEKYNIDGTQKKE